MRRSASRRHLYPLEWRLAPNRDEPAHGLLSRLAALHGFKFTADFGVLFGLDRSLTPVQRPSFTQSVAALSGCDPRKLADSTIEAREPGVFLGSECVSDKLSSQIHAGGRVCPQCLREDGGSRQVPYRRVFWELSMFSVCPAHGSELIRNCPKCGILLSFDLASPLFCLCGFDLRRCKEYRATAADRKGERHLADLLTKKARRNPLLLRANCDRTAQILATLGRFSTTQDGRGSWRDMPANVRARYVSAGLTVLDHWPLTYHQMLDGLLAAGKASRSGPSQYGPFYQWLNAQPADCEALREEFASHALANVPFGPASRLFGNPLADFEHVTLGYVINKMAVGSMHHGIRAARQLGFLPPGSSSCRIKLNQLEARSLVTRLKELETEAAHEKEAKRRELGRNTVSQVLPPRRAPPPRPPQPNSARTTSGKLGMHIREGTAFLRALADAGLIAVVRPGGTRCWYIEDDQIDVINKSFVSLSRIASAEPAGPRRHVRAALERYGIKPLIALPRNDAVYRTSDFPLEWNIAGMSSAELVSRMLLTDSSEEWRCGQHRNCAHFPTRNVLNAHGLRLIPHKNTDDESGGR